MPAAHLLLRLIFRNISLARGVRIAVAACLLMLAVVLLPIRVVGADEPAAGPGADAGEAQPLVFGDSDE
ncbi:MAG: hypothetical protein WCJ21_02615, partial [Planctomycetota bacterium]